MGTRRAMLVLAVVSAVAGCGSAAAPRPPRAAAPRVPCTAPLATHEPGVAAAPGEVVSLAHVAGTPVDAIEVGGAGGVPRALIDEAIATEVGAGIDPDVVRADVRRLWRLEVFGDVRVAAVRRGEHIALRYELAARPMIGRVVVAGARGDVRGWPRIESLAGGIYDAARLHRHARDQLRRYHRAGYLDAAIDVTEGRGPSGRVDVCFAVVPGPAYRIARIDVEGNRVVSDDAVRDALTGDSDELNTVGGIYDPARLRARMVWVNALFYEEGLITARVGEPRVTRDPRRGTVAIVVPIAEGPVYRVGEITFENASASRAVYLRHLGVTRGEVFRRSQIAAVPGRLRELEAERGREVHDVIPRVELDADRQVVDIRFVFQEHLP